MTNTSKVYILLNELNHIIRCEGGYTMCNIENISQWVLIDEGYGDRYNLCQSQYFEPPLYTEDGIPQWRYDNVPVLISNSEIDIIRRERYMETLRVQNYVDSGSLFTLNGMVYKATENIPKGELAICGCNCYVTSFESELYNLIKEN